MKKYILFLFVLGSFLFFEGAIIIKAYTMDYDNNGAGGMLITGLSALFFGIMGFYSLAFLFLGLIIKKNRYLYVGSSLVIALLFLVLKL